MNDKIKLYGSFLFTLEKADGSVEITKKDNIIFSSGFLAVSDSLFNSACRTALFKYIGIVEVTVAASVTDTLLGSELTTYTVASVRPVATYAFDGVGGVATLSHVFAPGEVTGNLTEAGVFNSSAANSTTMLDRVVFPAVNKGIDDTLTVTFSFSLS